MISYKTRLVLTNGRSYELSNCEFSFQQGIDAKGEATTEVYGGTIRVKLPGLPNEEILTWAMKYYTSNHKSGMIEIEDDPSASKTRLMFENAACVSMNLTYERLGDSYTSTDLVIQAEKLSLDGKGEFTNSWTE